MKELIHLKEVKELNKNVAYKSGLIDPIEVKYFNERKILNSEMTQLLDQIIQDVKTQCERKMNQIFLMMKKFEKERDSYKQRYEDSKKSKEPNALMKTIYDLEKNPYFLWKLVQDTYGNENVFRIFEDQKDGFGINWPEVDKQLANSSAGARDFKKFK